MKAQIKWQGKLFEADLKSPNSIAIPLKDGPQNPNCYFAEPVKFEVIKGDGFVGSIKLGGNVNHQKITISPHGNGTHTECYGHITDSDVVIANQLQEHIFVAQLISVTPQSIDGDQIINESVIGVERLSSGTNALIVRTMPNDSQKLEHNYSGTNPPYFTKEAMQSLVDYGIEHLITDLPSVDREQDEGRLSAHKAFWQLENELRPNATITELAFIPDNIRDGLYLLDLQILPIHLDVSPSNPILYSLSTIKE